MSDASAAGRLGASHPAIQAVLFPAARQSVGRAESGRDRSVGPEPANSAVEEEPLGVAIPPLLAHPAAAEKVLPQDPAAAEQSDAKRVAPLDPVVLPAAAGEQQERPAWAAALPAHPSVPLARLQAHSQREPVPRAEARPEEAVAVPRELVPAWAPPVWAALAVLLDGRASQA